MRIDERASDHGPDRRLRVLHVIDGLGLGGAEQLLVTLARHIDRTQIDLRVFTMRPAHDTAIFNDLQALSVPVHSAGTVRLRDVHLLPRFVRWIRSQEIDLVHTHLGLSDTWGGLGGRLSGRPLVSTLHIARDDAQRFGGAKAFLRRQVLRTCGNAVIVCTPSMKTYASRTMRIPAQRLVEIRNSIETDFFERADANSARLLRASLLGSAPGPLIVTVGNRRRAKGHEYLVSAMRHVVDRFPGAVAVIVGGPGDNDDAVRRHTVELNLQERVVMVGVRRDIPEILAASDLFVLPSLHEGLPLALLEAMAAGKPVVATAVDGAADLIRDGFTGLLVPPRDPETLADAIVDLLSHPDRATSLAAHASSHVRDHYGADDWARRLERLYVTVTTRREHERPQGTLL